MSINLPLLSNSKSLFITIPFSIVRHMHILIIRSLVLVAVATKFLLFLRIKTSTTCPYYHVQRCIAFHQFQMIYGILLLNWHGLNWPSADAMKGKARNVDSRIIALIWKLSASTPIGWASPIFILILTRMGISNIHSHDVHPEGEYQNSKKLEELNESHESRSPSSSPEVQVAV